MMTIPKSPFKKISWGASANLNLKPLINNEEIRQTIINKNIQEKRKNNPLYQQLFIEEKEESITRLNPAIQIYLSKLTGLFDKEEFKVVTNYFKNFKYLGSIKEYLNEFKFNLLCKLMSVREYPKKEFICKPGKSY